MQLGQGSHRVDLVAGRAECRRPARFEVYGAEISVASALHNIGPQRLCSGHQLGLGLLLVAFATGSDEAEFEAMNFS